MTRTIRFAAACYRRLLRLQPGSVRRRFAGDMTELFTDLARDAAHRSGPPGVARLMVRAMVDAVASATLAHRDAPDGWLRVRSFRFSPRLIMGAMVLELASAARALRRAPGFASLAVLTLGLGIAATVTAFGVVNAYLIRPLPFPAAERLVWVQPLPTREAFHEGVRPPDDLPSFDLSPLDGTFEDVAAWDLDGFSVVDAGEPAFVDGAWVSAGFFRVLGVTPALGRAFTAEEVATGAPVAVISHARWQRQFQGDPAVIGRTLTAFSTDRPREREFFTIIGVLPAEFWHFNRFTDVLVPLRGERAISIARLREGVTMAEAQRRLNVAARAQFPNADVRWSMSLMGARDEHVRQVRPTLLVLLGSVGFVMLVACANVAGLLVARAAERKRELAVRAALGAGRARLVAQFVAESALLAVGAAAVGIGLASLALDLLGPTVAEQLPATVPGGIASLTIDGSVLAFSAALAVATLALFGLLPAILHTKVDAARALADASRTSTAGRARARTRSTLVAAQLAVSLALLCGALMLVRTTREMRRLELGFDPRHVAKASLLLPMAQYPEPAQRAAFVRAVLERLSATPDIIAASVVNSYPFRGMGPRPIAAEGVADSTLAAVSYVVADRYLETVRVPLLRGRAFDARDDAVAPPIAMVSRSLAERAWPDRDPVGRRIKIGAAGSEAPWRTIVGVVHDTRQNLTEAPGPEVYVPYAQDPRGYFFLIARAAPTTSASSAAPALMRDAVRAVDDRQPLADMGTLTDVLEDAGASYRFLAILLTAFSIFTVALATLGIYGLLSYLVNARRQEIAVRIAFGARGADLLRMVTRQSLPMIAVGLAAGTWLSVLLGRALASAVEGVRNTGAAPLLGVAALLALAALLATLIPARRASRVPPMLVLRE